MQCDLMHGHRPGIECDWCAKPLTGRQRRWCSKRHSNEYTSHHRYSWAREAVLKVAQRPAGWECSHCHAVTEAPEVNHIVPVLGKHAQTGCWHHQANLEVVCHECHVNITRAQKAAGMFGKRG